MAQRDTVLIEMLRKDLVNEGFLDAGEPMPENLSVDVVIYMFSKLNKQLHKIYTDREAVSVRPAQDTRH
jgi:hypothetical protein